jgi:hypothetical protein
MSYLNAGRTRRPARGRKGQVIVVSLVGLTLMAGLIFFVYNLGDQVNRRLEMQNAADSAAVSGGGWMARSMNLVAMNNVGQAKLLSLVPVLDALPLSTEMAVTEVDLWQARLDEQLNDSIPNMNGAGDLISDGVRSLRDRMRDQRDILIPLNELLNESGFDMTEHTFWRRGSGAGPQGQLWRAAATLCELSEATAESAGTLAQINAARYGKASQARTAFMVPVLPRLPAVRGHFRDFQYLLEGREKVVNNGAEVHRTGGNGGAIPDMAYPHRLGPYAKLFRWRDYLRKATAWEWVSGTPGVGKTKGGSGGKVSVGGRRSGRSARGHSGGGTSGRLVATDWETYGYSPYGPFSWAMRRINWYANDHWHWEGARRVVREGHLDDTLFYKYQRDLARMKMGYMFRPGVSEGEYHYPDWITSFSAAIDRAENDEDSIHQTMFYLVEIASKHPPGSAAWLTPGTFRTNGERPIAIWSSDWVDPREWEVPKVADHIWRDEGYYYTTMDHEIDIDLKLDADGEPIWQEVYLTSFWIWGGIDVGEDVPVRNPSNYDSDEDLPYPLVMDTSEGDYDPRELNPDAGIRRTHFSYLGVAEDTDRAVLWRGRFKGVNPAEAIYAVAQAEVFNNKSWDLWTQDWQVRLKPVVGWEDWMDRMDAGAPDAPPEVLSVEDIDRAWEYLSTIDEETARIHLQH